ncbi:MAG: radical SAM protein [Oscillospiraceae bacterium]|nr:radical SAM protein [Oscillospiraceae bacterium]
MAGIIAAYIEITGVCDEKCPYCYNEKLVSTGESLPVETIVGVFSQLKDAGVSSAALSGGEPFLHKDLTEIFLRAKQMDFSVSVISNGRCFDGACMDTLAEYEPALQLTFDGWDADSHDATRGRGNFAKITRGVKTARERGYSGKINLRLNLHEKNISYLQKFFTMIEQEFSVDGDERDIESVSLAVIHRTESGGAGFSDYLPIDALLTNSEIAELSDAWNKSHTAQITTKFTDPDIGCPYNAEVEDVKCGLRIALDGNVFPCQAFTDDRFAIGNVFEERLSDITRGEKIMAFIEAVRGRRNALEECRPCAYKAVCSGGCPAMAFVEHGTLDAVSSICASRKAGLNRLFSSIMSEKRKKLTG